MTFATNLKAHASAQMWKRLMSVVCIGSSLPCAYPSATIMCGALQAVWEAEELKGQLSKAEGDLQDARAALGAEADSRAEAERQLQQVRQQNDSLRVSTHTPSQAQQRALPYLIGLRIARDSFKPCRHQAVLSRVCQKLLCR